MNTKFISLSSVNTDQTNTIPTIGVVDHTSLTLSLSGVTERLFPTHLTIDWGDDVEDFFENDILQNQNIASNVFSSLLIDTYTHEYFPSSVSTSQTLTATVSLYYTNSDISTFTLPLSITNYDYTTSVGDVKLVNTNFLQNGCKIHQLVTDEGGYLVELYRNDSNFIINDDTPDYDILISGILTPDATGGLFEAGLDGFGIMTYESLNAFSTYPTVTLEWEDLLEIGFGYYRLKYYTDASTGSSWRSDGSIQGTWSNPTDATGWMVGFAIGGGPSATGTPVISFG